MELFLHLMVWVFSSVLYMEQPIHTLILAGTDAVQQIIIIINTAYIWNKAFGKTASLYNNIVRVACVWPTAFILVLSVVRWRRKVFILYKPNNQKHPIRSFNCFFWNLGCCFQWSDVQILVTKKIVSNMLHCIGFMVVIFLSTSGLSAQSDGLVFLILNILVDTIFCFQ